MRYCSPHASSNPLPDYIHLACTPEPAMLTSYHGGGGGGGFGGMDDGGMADLMRRAFDGPRAKESHTL
eukprot:gene8130-biopygen6982